MAAGIRREWTRDVGIVTVSRDNLWRTLGDTEDGVRPYRRQARCWRAEQSKVLSVSRCCGFVLSRRAAQRRRAENGECQTRRN